MEDKPQGSVQHAESALRAYRCEATVDENGEVRLSRLPFDAGEPVEVIVLPRSRRGTNGQFPLRGLAVRYDRPTDPVAEDDWNALG